MSRGVEFKFMDLLSRIERRNRLTTILGDKIDARCAYRKFFNTLILTYPGRRRYSYLKGAG